MPVIAVKRGKLHRVVEEATKRIARQPSGTPVDGGGHRSAAKAKRQARAINANTKRKR
ncbi:MAG: hypothetical protein IH987_05195 [Planctomycetes bacterium]|nr:hypothetical protein [Planctomycetota bacterium]